MFTTREKKIANQVMKSIVAFDPKSQPQYMEDQSLIFIPEGNDKERPAATINLVNFFAEWKSLSNTERTERIEEVVKATLVASSESIDQRLASLRLRARTQEELNYRQHNPAAASERTPTIFGKDPIVLELVENSETHVKLATQDQLNELSISSDEAYKMAVAAHRRETDANQWQEIGDVWMSNYHDDFDFTRLLINGCETIFPFESSTAIVYAPSHSVCLVTNTEDAHSLEQLVSIGDQLSSGHRSLSKNLWTLNKQGQWDLYELALNPEAAHILKIQEIRENTLCYTDQQGFLERADGDKERHIGSYVGFETESGEIFSNTTYTINVITSLPKTDVVSIYDDSIESILAMLAWDDFATILGSTLTLESNLLPPRYTIDTEISDTQYQSIVDISAIKVA